MKKIIIVNNNMKIGGVQKSLSNLLWSIGNKYNVTLLLFDKSGELLSGLPPYVKVVECKGIFRFLGVSQTECKGKIKDYILRGVLAFLSRSFGRHFVINFMLKRQPKIDERFDCAIAYLHNGRKKSFYGGVQEYVLNCVNANQKVAFVHGDYKQCGANFEDNNDTIAKFDRVAACSDGCRRALESVLPHLSNKIRTVVNCHNFDEILRLSNENTIEYDKSFVNVIIVARLSREKGIERAIGSLSCALEKGLRVKLHIVGGGSLKSELANLVKKYGLEQNVLFYGEQCNPYKYIKNADLLFISSYHEAAPMVIDESICLGVPVLSTNTTSAEDMVRLRQCGWVCENDDSSINDAFVSIASNKDILKDLKMKLLSLQNSNNLAIEQFDALLS